jgi:hypothetical protein
MLTFTSSEQNEVKELLEWIKKNCLGGKLPPVPKQELILMLRSKLSRSLLRKLDTRDHKICMETLKNVYHHRVCHSCNNRLSKRNHLECTHCKGTLSPEEKTAAHRESIENGVMKKYGRRNVFAGPEGVRMVRKSVKKKYGVTNVMYVDEIRKRTAEWQKDLRRVLDASRKSRETMISRHGVEHWTQSPELISQFRDKMTAVHGVTNVMHIPKVRKKWQRSMNERDHNEVYQKASRTLESRTGFKNAFQDVENIKEKRFKKTGCYGPWGEQTKARYRDKTGYDYPYQNPEILEKALSKSKSSSLLRETRPVDPSKLVGNTRSVLGYEPFVINDLTQSRSVKRILVGSKIPGIQYTDTKGSTRTYHPDLSFRSKGVDVIVEVKSTYTLSLHLEDNLRKFMAACEHNNGKFLLAVVSGKQIFYIKNFQRLIRGIRRDGGQVTEDSLYRSAYKIRLSESVSS